MTVRINLTPDGGQWADVKEVSDLNAGDRRSVRAAVGFRINPETKEVEWPGDYSDRTKAALAARIIVNWNLQHPLPSGDASVLDRLTMGQYDALMKGITPQIDACQDQTDPTAEGTVPTNGSDS